MTGSKDWYASTTIQGGIVQTLVFLNLIFKTDLDEGIITELITGLFALIGTAMVIYGRLKATKVLK